MEPESASALLDYATPQTNARSRRIHPVAITVLDSAVTVFLISQVLFLLGMKLASRELWWRMERFALPAVFINLLTWTGASWIAAAYLTWRCFRTRGFRRWLMLILAATMFATLPWILGTLVEYLD
jgi:hypothetical protein